MTDLLTCIATIRQIPSQEEAKWGEIELADNHGKIRFRVAWFVISKVNSIRKYKQLVTKPEVRGYIWIRSCIALAIYKKANEELSTLTRKVERLDEDQAIMRQGKLLSEYNETYS